MGRAAGSAVRVHEAALRSVVVTRATLTRTGLSAPPIYDAIRRLEEVGVLREVTGRRRDRVWVYGEYLDLLNEGTE